MESEDDDSDIITYNKLQRYTNIDYREKSPLNSNNILNYNKYKDFNNNIVALISIILFMNL